MSTVQDTGALRRADGVELIGEMAGSGYRVPPSLARRGDGQTLQLTTLLYLTLHAIDGDRSVEEVAAAISERYGKQVSADNVRTLVDEQLRPLGLVTCADGRQPEVKRSAPLLGLRFRYAVTDPGRTRRLTAPFATLFRPFVVVPLLAAFALTCWWVLFDKGLASATRDAFDRPGLLLLVFAVTVLSAGFHEFGHAAAARYGGATPGAMGMGLYLAWPAFYTDVTDSYRLGRGGRVRTDLGGLYFNAIVAVAMMGVWLVTSYDALLLVVATQILQMLRQLTPLVRFDGYHVLADVTGVPDLFHRIKPTLAGSLPWRWRDPEARVLKPWARAVVTAWVLVVVPVLAFTLLTLVLTLPRVLGTAWAKLAAERELLASSWSDGDAVQVAARLLIMAAVALPVVGTGFVLTRMIRRAGRSVWRGTAGRPVRRTLTGALGVALVAGLAFAWWPHGDTYRPIQPGERGTLTQALTPVSGPAAVAAPARSATGPALERGSTGITRAVWDTSKPLPTKDDPQVAVVLVPHEDPDTGAVAGPPSASADAPEGWVFPFDQPLAPGEGDNQALATNTSDGTVTYDSAFALVWVEDGDDATNVNSAYAFADCSSCAAVAVSFQVVLVVGDSTNIVPQNLAGSLTSNCVNCLTYALAKQVLVTLDGPLSDDAMAALDALWAEIADYGKHLADVPLDEVAGKLDGYEDQILAIIEADQPGTVPTASSTASVSASPSASASTPASPSPSVTPSGSARPTSSPTASPSASPSPSASRSSSVSDSPSGNASPSASAGNPAP